MRTYKRIFLWGGPLHRQEHHFKGLCRPLNIPLDEDDKKRAWYVPVKFSRKISKNRRYRVVVWVWREYMGTIDRYFDKIITTMKKMRFKEPFLRTSGMPWTDRPEYQKEIDRWAKNLGTYRKK